MCANPLELGDAVHVILIAVTCSSSKVRLIFLHHHRYKEAIRSVAEAFIMVLLFTVTGVSVTIPDCDDDCGGVGLNYNFFLAIFQVFIGKLIKALHIANVHIQ